MTAATDRRLLTMGEIATWFKRERGTVEYWRTSGKLPEPDLTLGRTPGWYEDTLLAWGRRTGLLDEAGNATAWGRKDH